MNRNKRNILFLNGWMETSDSWDLVIHNLENEFNCYTLEFPGFGVAPTPKDAWTVLDYAEWVKKQIDLLQIERLAVIGHSFGGRVAIVLSGLDARIDKLILYGTPGFKEPNTKKASFFKSMNYLAIKIGIDREKVPFAKTIKDKISSEDYKNAGDMREIFKLAINFDLLPFMKKIDQPVLLIIGENDNQVSVRTAKKMHKTIANSELKILPKNGHFAHLENSNLFCGVIRGFINEKSSK